MKRLISGLASVACSMLVMAAGAAMFLAQHPGDMAALA